MAGRSKGGKLGRWIRAILVGAIAVVVLLATLAVFLLGTSAGGRVALALAEGLLPDDVSMDAQEFTGRLLGRFELGGVRFRIPLADVEVRRIAVDWDAPGILWKRMHVKTAVIEGVDVRLLEMPPDSVTGSPAPPGDGGTGPPASNLPFEIAFDSVTVSDVTVRMRDSVWLSDGDAEISGGPSEYRMALSGRGSVPGIPPAHLTMAGMGTAAGARAEELELQVLDGVISGTADVTWWPEVSWTAELKARELVPAPLLPDPDEWPGHVSFAVAIDGHSGTTGLDIEARVDTLFGVLREEPLDGRFDARVRGAEIDLDAARITWGPASVGASGTAGETIDAVFEATIPDLGLVLPGAAGRFTASGRASGRVDAPRIAARFAADSVFVDGLSAATAEGEADLELAGDATRIRSTFTAQAIAAGELTAATLDGELDLDLAGEVKTTVLARTLSFSGRALDSATVRLSGLRERHELELAALGPGGAIELSATGGLGRSNAWSGRVESLRLSLDSLRTWTLAAPVALAASASGVELDQACLESPPARICAAGALDDRRTRVAITADSVDVARLQPLMPADFSIETMLNADVDLELVSDGELTGTLDVRTGPGRVSLVGEGEPRVFTFEPITVSGSSGEDGIRAEVDANLTDSSGGRLLDLSGRLESPVAVRSTADLARLRGQPVSVHLDMVADDLQRLTQGVIPAWDVTGGFRATANVEVDPEGRLTGTAEAATESLVLRNAARGRGWILTVDPARIQATVGPDGLTGELALAADLEGHGSLITATGRISLPRLSSLDVDPAAQPLEARFDVEVADLSVVEAFLYELSEASGHFELHTEVGGTLADATVEGAASLRDGRALVPALGLDLNGIQFQATGQHDGAVAIDGEVRSGSGQLTIKGRSERYPTGEAPNLIQVRGNRFRVMDTPEIQIEADPAIDVLFDGSTMDLAGQIVIPHARLGLPDIPAGAITPSEDVLIVGDTAEVRGTPVPFAADLTVRLGDDVFFNGEGLTGNLIGELNITQQPGRQPSGRGELRLVRGTFRSFGQELQIDPGRLVFAGPLDDPRVDARAFVRASDQTEAGFRIGGTVKNLDVRTYSVPPMPESDVMAYILFGYPMNQTTATEGREASNAAAVLGANMLGMSLAPSLGLDEARIDTGSSQNKAQLVVGKYLSPRLYVGYGVGLYEPISTLRMRYLLSARWSVEAITGDQQSTDLLWRIERGGSKAEAPVRGSDGAEGSGAEPSG